MQVIAVCIFSSAAGVPALILDPQLFVSLWQEWDVKYMYFLLIKINMICTMSQINNRLHTNGL